MSLSCEHAAGFVATGVTALFSLGLLGSLHCVGMCGPLSCLAGGEKSKSSLIAYHAARIASYAGLGALLWKLGAPLRLSLPWPWLLALISLPLAAYALAGPFELPPLLAKFHASAFRGAHGFAPLARGAALGLLTPLLPCGLLYSAAGFSLAAPSALSAAAWMLAFAAGTFPLLALSQAGWRIASSRMNFSRLARLRRGAAGLAAIVVLIFAFLEHR